MQRKFTKSGLFCLHQTQIQLQNMREIEARQENKQILKTTTSSALIFICPNSSAASSDMQPLFI